MCARNINGGRQNPRLYLRELSIDHIKKFFPTAILKNLKEVFICGSYGEPILAKDILEITNFFVENTNSETRFFFDTNGSVRSPSWWHEFASFLPPHRSLVAFGLDGLRDTHAIYRRGTNFDKILDNAKSFIQAGGNARWSFLAFKHNEHQIEEARELASNLGFSSFLVKKTGRFFSSKDMQARDQHPVWNKDDELEYYLEPPTNKTFRNQSVEVVEQLSEEYGSFQNYLDNTEIICDSLKRNRIYVAANGVLLPCGFLNHQLFDPENLYGASQRQLSDLVDINELNLHYHNIYDILNSDSYKKIINSTFEGFDKINRLKTCALFCGKEFRKVDDQLTGKYGL